MELLARSRLIEAEAEPAGRRPQDLPVPLREATVERVNQLETDITYHPEARVSCTRRGDGLVQPVVLSCSLSADPGGGVLCGGAEAGRCGGTAGHLPTATRVRSLPARSYRGVGRGARSDQHGREGPLHGQHLRRRLWRSLKYEEVYLKDTRPVTEARAGIAATFGSTTTSACTRASITGRRRRSTWR